MPLLLGRDAMKTRFELVLAGVEDDLRAGEAALDEVSQAEAELSRFRRDSVLSHLHREAARAPVRLRADHFALLELCARVHHDSGGRFDPSVAPLLERDGVGDEPAEPASADAPVGFSAVQLDADSRSVFFSQPGVRLDLGGVAKGWALDRAGELLRDEGVGCALLHGGTSSVFAIGRPPERADWAVAIRDPRDEDAVLVEVGLEDRALSVSGTHGRRGEDGRGHVVDPASGRRLAGTRLAAVVLESAAEADAWSTALVAGADPERCPATWWMFELGEDGEACVRSGGRERACFRSCGP